MLRNSGSSNASPATPASDVKREARQLKTLTRSQLADRIAQGETLVLHRRKIYKLDRWLARHPGGELAILHFVGRDATDEIEAYHSDETISRLMSRFVIGYLDQADWDNYRPLVPPVQLGYRKGKLDHRHQVRRKRMSKTSLSAPHLCRITSERYEQRRLRQHTIESKSLVPLFLLKDPMASHYPSTSLSLHPIPIPSIRHERRSFRKRIGSCISASNMLVSTRFVPSAMLVRWLDTSSWAPSPTLSGSADKHNCN